MIPVRIPWTEQPPDGTPIDWRNPLTKGLKVVHAPGMQGNDRNIVNASPMANAREHRAIDGEQSIVYSKDTAYTTFDPLDTGVPSKNAGGMTYLFWYRVDIVTSGAVNYFGGDNQTGNHGWYLYMQTPSLSPPDQTMRMALVFGGVAAYAQSNPVPCNNWIQLGVTGEFNSDFDYVANGELDVNVSVGTPISNTDNIELYGRSTASHGSQGEFALSMYWERRLSAAEIASLNENPWQIFEPRTIWYPLAAAAPAPATRFIPMQVPWTEPPPIGTPLDASNPLTKGLVHGIRIQDGVAVNIVTGETYPLDFDAGGVDYKLTPTDFGQAVERYAEADSTAWAAINRSEDPSFFPERTFDAISQTYFVALPNQAQTWDQIVWYANAAGTGGSKGFRLSQNWRARFYIHGTAWNTQTEFESSVNNVVANDNKFHGYTGVWHKDKNGGACEFYRDGVSYGLSTATQTGVSTTLESSWNPAVTLFASRHDDASSTYALLGKAALWLFHDRDLSAEETASLHDNPWQIYEPRTVWYPLSPQKIIFPVRRVRTSQPPAGTPIDWSNPITKGLVRAVYAHPNIYAHDSVSGDLYGSAGTDQVHVVNARFGRAVKGTANDNSSPVTYTQDAPFSSLISRTITMVAGGRLIQLPPEGSAEITGDVGALGTSFVFSFSPYSVTVAILTQWNGATLTTASDPNANPEAGHYYHMSGTANRDAPLMTLRVKDLTQGTSVETSSATDVSNDFNNFNTFMFANDSVFEVSYNYLFDRVLTQQEQIALEDNPWQIFEPEVVWYSMDAATGEISVVQITSVDGDDSWADGASGLIVLGSGFML